ncbi:MAG: NADH-quinone oxidoreductase subunit L [Thermoanaerobaculia bacterium]
MSALDYLWLIPALPLAGAAVNGLLVKNRQKALATAIGVGAPGLSLAVALACLVEFLARPGHAAFELLLYPWTAGALQIDIAFLLDPLSAVMLFVVTFVGFLIHVYSVGYMAHEEGYRRYFAYLNLFMCAMLLLVLGDNYLVMFVGWEGVGLCSYLLIGFYFDQDFPPRAGRKAFIVNRIGDFAFLVGLFAIFAQFGTLSYKGVNTAILANVAATQAPYAFGLSLAGFIALCLFVGAMGKSAQIPLYVWLPDAMAGPTPVSALIHAATMVTAGVYMVARTNLIYQLAPSISMFVAIVGAATALFAATIGIAQNDIKKVLAYSTVSQLGYMFLAAGAGAYVSAVFHLATHAFFKALLFLGSGSVIHAMGGEQDMRKMGDLRRHLPWTYRTFLIGTLAISGVPFLAGFFSKDAILGAAFEKSPVLWLVGLVTAGLTACYMMRLLCLTFLGKFRGTHEQEHHLHESPAVMVVPLVILAGGAIFAGYAGKIPFTHFDWLGEFLAPVIVTIPGHELRAAEHELGLEALLVAASVAAALAGLLVAWRLWGRGRGTAADEAWARRSPRLYRLIENKYFVDEIYDRFIVRPLRRFARFCWKVIDSVIIDGGLHVLAFLTELAGDLGRFTTTGNVRQYALYFFGGVLVLFWWMIF